MLFNQVKLLSFSLVLGLCFLWCLRCVSFSEYRSLQDDLSTAKKRNASLQQELDKVQKITDHSINQRDLLIQTNQYNKKQLSIYKKILEGLKRSLAASGFELRSSGGRVVLVLPADILFDSGSDIISKKGIHTIEKVTSILIANSNCKYQIEGHTDNIPIHTSQFPSNWELAGMRAINVLHAMVAVGMPPERISSASFADTRPLQANDDEISRKYNRRIEIALLPDLSKVPLEKL